MILRVEGGREGGGESLHDPLTLARGPFEGGRGKEGGGRMKGEGVAI